MTIKDRSVARVMHLHTKRAITHDAVTMLRMHLEGRVQNITVTAERILDQENIMRKQIGERVKKKIAPRHIIAAIEGRVPQNDEH